MNRRRLFHTALATVTAGLVLSLAPPASAGHEQVGGLPYGGVVTHLSYFNTSYANATLVGKAVKVVEAKWVRQDGPAPGQSQQWYDRYYRAIREVHRISGAKFVIVVNRADWDAETVVRLLEPLVNEGIVGAIEGSNEWDNVAGRTDPNWAQQIRDHQRALWSAVKSRWPNLTVVGPSLSYKITGAYVGDLSAYLDVGNFHYYGLATGIDTRDLDARLADKRKVSGSKPMIATESNGVIGDGYVGTELDQANTMRLLHQLLGARGVHRVFTYETLQPSNPKYSPTHRESNFGIYERGGDGRWYAKPVFFPVRDANRREGPVASDLLGTAGRS